MKTTIEKIEALKAIPPKDYIEGYQNTKIDDVIEILRNQKTIKARAIREKNTGKWLGYSDIIQAWKETGYPQMIFPGQLPLVPEFGELVDITIIVEEP